MDIITIMVNHTTTRGTIDDLSHDVSDILCSDVLTNDEKLELAGLMVAMASIRKEANEAKNKKTTITS